jgi:methylmalonyl-CoA mutase
MSKLLFNDFNAVTSKQWKQKIQADLKGADYNDTLIWQTAEDIHVKPFYHADAFDFNLNKISNSKATEWNICQSIYVFDINKSNKKALQAISKGAESIKFIIPNENTSISNLIENIDTNKTTLFFELEFISEEFINQFVKISNSNNVYVFNDIIGNLAKSGNWFKSLEDDHKKFDAITGKLNTISIDLGLYQNAGANMVQQLAYALAHTNEYLNHLDSKLNKQQKQTLKVVFNVAVGTNYFFEIAKLRALRILWKSLANMYSMNEACLLIVTPSKRNKTIYDYNTNLLRTTTECMSAILGGTDTICNLAYDAIYHKDNEFGERIARNQLLILKHESYFNKVNNPADGTYYIEEITNQLAEKSLELFKNIEANGGFLKQLKEGTIQRKIKESAHKEQQQFNNGEEVLLGSNKHPNPNDKMKHDLELYPFVKTNQRKTLIEPIIEKRLAEKLEQERLKKED